MKLHRFYFPYDMKHEFWLKQPELLYQWNKVLRFRAGQQVVLFDGRSVDRLYEIVEMGKSEAHLKAITDYSRSLPTRDVYLFWALLKKDKNDWVLQKCTELGVSHFIPIITERCEKSEVSSNRHERWQKIITEAAEQCGRSDIPTLREPVKLQTVFDEFESSMPLYICEQGSEEQALSDKTLGVLVGPEGGWSEAEKENFEAKKLPHLGLHNFTLRAETAAVAASAKLLQ